MHTSTTFAQDEFAAPCKMPKFFLVLNASDDDWQTGTTKILSTILRAARLNGFVPRTSKTAYSRRECIVMGMGEKKGPFDTDIGQKMYRETILKFAGVKENGKR